MGPATTLTACHGCLIGPGSFVFVTIRRISFTVRHWDPERRSHQAPQPLRSIALRAVDRVLTVYARSSAGYFAKRKRLLVRPGCRPRRAIQRSIIVSDSPPSFDLPWA